jgi:hypothetical protein
MRLARGHPSHEETDEIIRIGRDESTCSSLVGRLLSRMGERLLSRIAEIPMWFAASARQVMTYRIQTDP